MLHEIEVICEADVILVRQAAMLLGKKIGLGRYRLHALATAVTELAMNQVIHASGGVIKVLIVQKKDALKNDLVGVEVDCLDHGPGIVDIDLAMQDGYSTSHGLGGGLPGVRRLMDEFEIESKIGFDSWTRIVTRLWQKSC
ncbi:Serine/threonine-protein kinase RsbT [Azospirillaceae bacterium]